MPYPAQAVANYFLDLAAAEKKSLTPMQIQKLVFFAYGWFLALCDKPLVDEHPEAWDYGPVFPSLYQTFKDFGGGDIEGHATDVRIETSPKTGKPRFRLVKPSLDDPADIDRDLAKRVVARVWAVYGSWSGVQLSALSHISGGPWEQTRQANPGRKGSDIPDALIQKYFNAKISGA